MYELKDRIHENGIDYILCGDYYIPEWQIPQNDRPIGHFGRMRKAYLKEYRPALYAGYIARGTLFDHCTDINEQAQQRLEVMMEQIVHEWGIKEEMSVSTTSSLMRCCVEQSFPTGILLYCEQVY